MESNYDKVIETWRQKFLTMDQEELISKFHLESDEAYLYLTYFSRKLQISRETGVVRYVEQPGIVPGFGTIINTYNLFHYAIKHPVASGNLVLFREVKRVYPFEKAYRNTILHRLEKLFAGKTEELRRACEQLGGIRMKQGDAGYILPVYPFLQIAVLFWDGDEEFPPQANMLFDSNITDFMHEENVVSVASDAVYYLQQAAGMEAKEPYGTEI